jgi:acyl-coenzyme A synthetase/AMP-(fatty) acid ligase
VEAIRFLADVEALAQSLPDRKHVVNRIADRYYFTVGFAAAMVRKQLTLLPPNDTLEMMHQLSAQYPDTYCLTDAKVADGAMPQHLCFADHLAAASDFSIPAFDEDQIAALIFTSGSTGQPMPHPRSWGALTRSVERSGVCMGLTGLESAAILATVSPQHSYGLESSVMVALQHRLALTPSKPFYPADIAQQLESLPRPRILVTTPVHLRVLTADTAALPKADLVISATAPLSAELAAEAEALFACPLLEIYGCTEAGQISWRRTTRETQWRCFTGITLSQDTYGTWASGYQINRKTLLNDVVELYDEERFELHGRNADMVNIAGKRASLAHLNHHLNSIDGVVDGAFVLPEDTKDAVGRLAALAVAPTLTIQNVMTALRQRIDPIFLPRPLIMLDRLPRNANGKLTRQEVDRLLVALPPTAAPESGEVIFAPDAPFVAGHFPSNPVVPGAMLLQEVLRLLQDRAALPEHCEIRAAKFLRPVRPGDRVEIRWIAGGDGDIPFDCFVADAKVLTGTVGSSTEPA